VSLPPAAGARRAVSAGSARFACDHGAVTLWLLGVCVTVLFLGGISLDLWRGFSERRAIAGVADAAAAAGAAGVDEAHLRVTGEVRLHRDLARTLAAHSLAGQTASTAITGVRIEPSPERITVVVHGTVELSLLRILLGPRALPITVTAGAEPVRAP
jgi:hypothetical protein